MKCLLLVTFVIFSFPVISQTNWQLVKKENNISIYTRAEKGSLYNSFKAVGTVLASPQKLFEVIDDVSSYRKWFAFSKSARLIKGSKNIKYVYMETGFPWPFLNEDIVYKISSSKKKNGAIELILEGNPRFIPPTNRVNRMRYSKGYIFLIPDKNQTQIIFSMHTELGGDIPPWLANKFIHELPFQTLKNLMAVVQNKRG